MTQNDLAVFNEVKRKIEELKERRIREEERLSAMKQEAAKIMEELKKKYAISPSEIDSKIEEQLSAVQIFMREADQWLEKISELYSKAGLN